MADAEDKGLAEDREQSKDWKLFGPYLRERQWGERYHQFYGNDFRVECPTGSGRWLTLGDAAIEIASRLTRTFLPDSEGHRPCHGSDPRFSEDLHWRDLVLFYEYFHGDTGRGLRSEPPDGLDGFCRAPARASGCSPSNGASAAVERFVF